MQREIVVNKKWAIAGGGLLLTLLLGFGSYQFISGQNAIEEPPTPTVPEPPPPPINEAWRLARIKVSIANKLTNDAKTKADWEEVASAWEEVIALLKQVPDSSSYYEKAQNRIDTYQKVVEIAKRKAIEEPPTPTVPEPPSLPPATNEAWGLARIKASIAGKLTNEAKTKADWEEVAREWEEVIALLKQVPDSSSYYEKAQNRIETYQKVVKYAKGKAAE